MPEDFDLVHKAQTGNTAAFRELVLRYQKTAYYFALDLTGNHQDAEDLSQDVFVAIYQALPGFRGEAAFSTWLYRITVNTWYRQRRRRNAAANPDSLDDLSIHIADDDSHSPENRMENRLMHEHVQRAMRRLSPQEKAVFVLRQKHEQKLDEIAGILNLKTGTVKSLLFRALKKMQKELSFYQIERMS